ncbi:putative lipopolysaccharide heptosyltransferase III [Erwinia rhapontici]|uniref:putative lipopolysaccharide heptosyltransferase III n=1 Tax=Erwinia rhapontici TaxID=55212 RepID=UPI0014383D21|nr:putative lipopolysaccharide heptosyltransferase III [Erwinia rhapontici]NKG32777.1 putative lipopolysaccharide heptosyltransferase III [Erwinia rhapontici]
MNSALVPLPKRILVIKLRHHGDMLLTTPVINTLKQNWPQADVDVLLYQETKEMLSANPAISRLITIDRQWKKLGAAVHIKHEWQLLQQLRDRQYDVVINLADQWRSALAARWTSAKIRLGFDFPKRRGALWRFCHTRLVSIAGHEQLHTVEQNLSLLAPLGDLVASSQVIMSYNAGDWQKVEGLLRQQAVQGKFIVVQPTSRWFFKCWTEANMAATISALQADGYTLVITSGPDKREQEMVATILASSPEERVISLAGQLTLRQLAALIDHAQLFLGVDSVPMHMAAALNTPCVALFGPSKLTLWHPWQAQGKTLWAGDYGPLPDPDDIDTKTDERYLDLIPVEVVLNAIRELLI